MKTHHYFDYAAATPLDPRVLKAMQPYLTERFANPSSLHTPGREQRAALTDARKRIAGVLGAKPAEIIFTSGSTEGINLAMQGVLRGFPQSRVVISAIEHEAVVAVASGLERGWQVGTITVGESGVVDSLQLAAAIDDTTVLVCLQYANNEIGSLQPISRVAAEVARIRADRLRRGVTRPLYLFCDAAQAGMLSLAVARLGVDLLTMGGSKIYGPPGSGFLYVRTGTQLQPILYGGGQENSVRPGTENVAAAVGLAAALELVQADRAAEAKRQAGLRDWIWQELRQQLDGLLLNGTMNPRLPSNLNLVVNGAPGETLVAHLDAAGIAVATGAACLAASDDPSPVLLAIGRTPEQAAASLRLTLGRGTSKADAQSLVNTLRKVVPRVRQL
ncbi:MAG TPA: cysteine desulfurase family protein [Candidatus Saccharimonadales bacterium]|nr:cysteine desulfurase family protein [Candidatus Saccharimonadales bacterium]